MQELRVDSELQGGKYRIVKKLGQGGFGITYEGVQTGLERRVAIKEFFMKDYCNRNADTSQVTIGSEGSREMVDDYRRKFLKEAQLIARMEDVKGVVRIHDIFEENQTAYYVMEFIPGGSLKQLVEQRGRLPEDEAVGYVRQVGQALQQLHSQSILHLDVKPDNILLNRQGEAVLIDFGVSKHYDKGGSQTSSTPVGLSKGFAPSEQYQQDGVNRFSPATDVYSLGATLFYLLTATAPPDANLVFEDGLPARAEYISLPVWQAIEQAMQPRKKDRTQTVEAFLKEITEQHPVSVAQQETMPPVQEESPKPAHAPLVEETKSQETLVSGSTEVSKQLSSKLNSKYRTYRILVGLFFLFNLILFVNAMIGYQRGNGLLLFAKREVISDDSFSYIDIYERSAPISFHALHQIDQMPGNYFLYNGIKYDEKDYIVHQGKLYDRHNIGYIADDNTRISLLNHIGRVEKPIPRAFRLESNGLRSMIVAGFTILLTIIGFLLGKRHCLFRVLCDIVAFVVLVFHLICLISDWPL